MKFLKMKNSTTAKSISGIMFYPNQFNPIKDDVFDQIRKKLGEEKFYNIFETVPTEEVEEIQRKERELKEKFLTPYTGHLHTEYKRWQKAYSKLLAENKDKLFDPQFYGSLYAMAINGKMQNWNLISEFLKLQTELQKPTVMRDQTFIERMREQGHEC